MIAVRSAGAVACLVACMLLSGCGGDEGQDRYVGAITATDAFVAIVTDGERVVAYVCDGVPGKKPATIAAWFSGVSDGRHVDVRGSSGGGLVAQLADDTLTGAITLVDGRRFSYRAPRVSGNAGLYRGEARGALAGWIVAADGRQRGSITGVRRESLVLRLVVPLSQSPPAVVVSKNIQGLVPSPLTAADFESVSKD